MVLQVVNYTLTANGTPMDLGTADHLLLGRFGIIASTDDQTAVLGSGNLQRIRVEGTVSGGVGIQFGLVPFDQFSDHVLVTSTGFVSGTSKGVEMKSGGSVVINYGLIEGNSAVYFSGQGRIENHGDLQGVYGIDAFFGIKITVLNTGTINGTAYSITASLDGDSIRNTGTLFGAVAMIEGDDVYDGRGGTVEGTIYGGPGNDIFRLGAGVEVVEGNEGTDTLDFSFGPGIRVYLGAEEANSGAAFDDEYTGIECIKGSRLGADYLVGDAAANLLSGQGGRDTLIGGAGADSLVGGNKVDVLTGGLGNDAFVFYTPDSAGDTITDFHRIAGDNDLIRIAVAGFGGGLPTGALAANRFVTGPTAAAGDANDRVIWKTTDHTLWFDANGSAAEGLTLIAKLDAAAVVTAADIFII